MTDCSNSGSNSVNDKCPDEVKNMTAQQACQQVQEKTKNIWDAFGGITDAMSPGKLVESIGNAFKGTADSTQQTINKVAIDMKTKGILVQTSDCENNSSQEGSNTINGLSPECIQVLLAYGYTKEDLQNAGSISNVSQQITQNSSVVCSINQLIDAVTKMDATIDNQAVMNALNEAKGLMSSSESSQMSCNDLSASMSACKYIQQTQCCNNKVSQKHQNMLDKKCSIGAFTNINQNIDATALSSCLLSSQSGITDDMSSKLFNKNNFSADNKSEGLTTAGLFIILLIIALVVFSPMILEFTMSGGGLGSGGSGHSSLLIKIIFILALILGLTGIVMIVLYFVNKKDEQNSTNTPYFLCSSTKYQQPIKVSYKDAKQKVKEDSSLVGFDFIIDKEELKNNTISDDQIGLVAYLTTIDRSKTQGCDNTSDKSYIITYIKEYKDIKYIIIGSCLLLGALLLFLFGFFKR
jgi:hypothetical protein